MKKHWIIVSISIVAVILLTVSIVITVQSCKKDESPSCSNAMEIQYVYPNAKDLAAIETGKDDLFENFYNNYQPYIDKNGGMYYYEVIDGDSAQDQLLFNGGTDAVRVDLPSSELFTLGAIVDDVAYGVERRETDGDPFARYLISYSDGDEKLMCEEPIFASFFAPEGVYYQAANIIYLMDYSGGNAQQVLEIPDELYYEGEYLDMAVCNGKLWYCYDNLLDSFLNPLWCYDFNGNILRFSDGGLDKVNNGYLYYTKTNEDYSETLYRFNAETYEIECVLDYSTMGAYTFYKDYIIFVAYDSKEETEALYKFNNEVCEPFLYAPQLGGSDFILSPSSCDDRLFVTGGSGMFYTYLAEIDLDGNIVNVIHEDPYSEWIDEQAEVFETE